MNLTGNTILIIGGGSGIGRGLAEALHRAGMTVAVDLLGPMRLTAALLPTLLGQPHAAIVNVTSALAFVPKAVAPTYSATKAGLHAYTQSLRRQLRHTPVQVIEIIPPQVETDMLAGHPSGPHAMSLDAFVVEAMSLLRSQPDAGEIVVEAARRVRFAARDGHYDDVFDAVNP